MKLHLTVYTKFLVLLVFCSFRAYSTAFLAYYVIPPVLAPHIRYTIYEEIELGFDNNLILAGHPDISLRSLQRIRSTWEDFGKVYILSKLGIGRPRRLNILYKEELFAYLE